MEKDIVLDGIKIHYREEAPAEGASSLPLVVLLHGWGANIELFDRLFRQIGTKYQVTGMDMPGFGRSEEPAEALDIDGYAEFVTRFVTEVYPEKKEVIFLGHSHGGRTIIHLLAGEKLPFHCPKAILVDSAGIVPERTEAQKKKTAKYHFYKNILMKSGAARLFPGTLDRLQKKFGSADYAAASPLMRQSMVKVVNADLREEMPRLKMPVLLIWGTADTATPLKDGELMEKLMPEAGLALIQGAGHFSFLDQPELFGRILGSFLGI